MKKYDSIKEMEDDQKRQKDTWNRACIRAMTDEELTNILSMIESEQLLRERDDELQQEKEQERRFKVMQQEQRD